MKLRFVGGHQEEVRKPDPKDPRKDIVTKREQLTQTFEAMEYHWPKKGTVLVVSANVGGWLLGKLGKLIEEVPEDPASEKPATPNRLVAVAPEETKPSDPPPAKQ